MSDSAIVQTLKQELSALEADMRTDPRFRKIERIRALLAEYPSEQNHELLPSVTTWLRNTTSRDRPAIVDSKASHVRETIRELLAQHEIVHRSEFLRVLTERGIMGQEKNPIASLAAYLSDFKEFESAGAGKWKLASISHHGAPSREQKGAP